MPADNQPVLTFLLWRERGRGDQQRDAALTDTLVLSRVLGAGARHRAAQVSPLLLETCPKEWVKVGFGTRGLDGDRKRKSLRLAIVNADISGYINLEIMEFGPS